MTAKKAGKTTVTVTAGGKKYKCALTVKAKAKKIELNVSNPYHWSYPHLNIHEGESYQLRLKNADASKVKWKSSRPKIATVSSNGLVKGIKSQPEGAISKITATYKGKEYQCTVGVRYKETYTLKLDVNGGDWDNLYASETPESFYKNYDNITWDGASSSLIVKSGTGMWLDAIYPGRDDYIFTGWYTKKEGGKRKTDYETNIDKDMTLYAHWTPGTPE